MLKKQTPTVSNKRVLSYFAAHAWRCKKWVIMILIFSVIGVGAQTVTPWIFKLIVDALTDRSAVAVGSVALMSFFAMYVATKLVIELGWRIAGYAGIRMQSQVMADLQEENFAYTLGHSFEFFVNNFTGSLVKKINRIARAYERIADELEFRFLPAIVLLTGTFIGLFLRSSLIALIFLFWAALFIILNFFMMRWKLKYDIERASVDSLATAELADAMSNSIPIKLFNGFEGERRTYGGILERWRKLTVKSWGMAEGMFAAQGLMMVGIEAVLLYLGIQYWRAGILTVGDIVLIQSYLTVVIARLWDIGRSFRNVFEGIADAAEMIEVLDLPHEIQDHCDAKKLIITAGQIDMVNVDFNYHETRSVFKKFNLTIEPGQKIALVGTSGAGKSTLIKLLFRFYELTAGSIKIDGQDISAVTQQSLRHAISLVPQEAILFHRSLIENIRYGRPGATRAEVIGAAKKAQCHKFIEELPDGYDTLVGERGVKLSGGERQRVTIARAILKNAPILVLDEATSSLDSESEQLIQKALRELMKGKTTIVIAHRLSTIMMMDKIVVVEGGKVIDSGTHDELLQKQGVYQKLWNIQAGGFLKDEE